MPSRSQTDDTRDDATQLPWPLSSAMHEVAGPRPGRPSRQARVALERLLASLVITSTADSEIPIPQRLPGGVGPPCAQAFTASPIPGRMTAAGVTCRPRPKTKLLEQWGPRDAGRDDLAHRRQPRHLARGSTAAKNDSEQAGIKVRQRINLDDPHNRHQYHQAGINDSIEGVPRASGTKRRRAEAAGVTSEPCGDRLSLAAGKKATSATASGPANNDRHCLVQSTLHRSNPEAQTRRRPERAKDQRRQQHAASLPWAVRALATSQPGSGGRAEPVCAASSDGSAPGCGPSDSGLVICRRPGHDQDEAIPPRSAAGPMPVQAVNIDHAPAAAV